MISTSITGMEREIDSLLGRLKDYTLVSPLSGIVLDTYSDSTLTTLIRIGDLSAYAVLIPLNLKIRNYVSRQQEMEFNIDGIQDTFKGKILKLSNVVQIVNGEQTVIATAIVETSSKDLLPGIMAKCKIVCEPLTLKEYVYRTFNVAFKR